MKAMKSTKNDVEEKGKKVFEIEFTFKPFHQIYRIITVLLALGFMFPNPATDKFRIISIVILFLCSVPADLMIFMDIYNSWQERDIFNIIRHSTIVGPIQGVFLKMLLMFYKRVQAKAIIDEMNQDYESFNRLPRRYQAICDSSISSSVFYSEGVWFVLVTSAIMAFPAMGVLFTLFSYLTEVEPRKFMVHDINKPFSEPEARFESPYFEIIFAYCTGLALMCVFNFVAYDSFFAVATNHACLKISINRMKLEDVFKMNDPVAMNEGFFRFIDEQKRMYRFVSLIQDTFNIWLGVIYTSTMIQIGSLLFHITAGFGFDFRYTLFSVASVFHVFLPCKHAAKLKSVGAEMASHIYCSGWEAADTRVWRVLPLVLARAQLPLHVTAFEMLVFDMELFVFMMKTSYSMFTLLRP